ncbi:hypothetical protein J3E69DRAFT_382669 [Trichoderma sp. SZMC 28015]
MDKDDSESSIESPICSKTSWAFEPAETSRQAEDVSCNSQKESTEAPSISSIIELRRECASAFEACMRHEDLLEHEWAKNSFADFNFILGSFGVRSAANASPDILLDSEIYNRPELHSNLTELKDFLAGCIRCAEAQSNIDEATKKVDSSLKELLQTMETINSLEMRSRFEQGDDRFKPEEHEDLRIFLTTICLQQHTKNDMSTKVSELSEAQQRLIEVNLRRRNRFLQAQERYRQESVGDHTKASTTQGNLQAQEAEEKAPQPVMMVLTALSAAGQYPEAPKVPQGTMAFECPYCYETLPAIFANKKKLWRRHLAKDISAYTCILPDCPTPFATYSTVFDWENHFKKKHPSCYNCLMCDDSDSIAFPDVEALKAHIETEHGKAVSPGLFDAMISFSPAKTIGTSQCPLCGLTGVAHRETFIRHVLDCIHEFSLYSLPWDLQLPGLSV